MLQIQREIWTVSCKLGMDSVTGVDVITLDANELSLLWPLSSQEEEWELDWIAQAVQTGDSTWGLKDASACLIPTRDEAEGRLTLSFLALSRKGNDVRYEQSLHQCCPCLQ